MRQTLFLIPHEVAGLPIFGFGWLLILMGGALVARVAWAYKSGRSMRGAIASEGIMWGIALVAVVFLLPAVERQNIDGQSVGMAVRGYGVMMLIGASAAVGLAMVRVKNRGIDSDVILSLAPWTLGFGLVGARMFYVIQYRDQFIGESIFETIRNIVAFPDGGLVVYGGFIGGFLASMYYLTRHRLPIFKLGDAIVPCMFLGLVFGRIGCLMNGCCYGGRCEDGWSAIEFPPGSPVYKEQLYTGELLGMKVDEITSSVKELSEPGLASSAGIEVGGHVDEIVETVPPVETAPRDVPSEDVPRGVRAIVDGKAYYWSASQLPTSALPVQAAQIISSGSALLMCLLLCGLSYFFRRDGAIMMLGFAAYAVLRFVLELVRVDEGGQFGTGLSISQWVSIGVLTLAIGGLIWVYSDRRTPAKLLEPSAE